MFIYIIKLFNFFVDRPNDLTLVRYHIFVAFSVCAF